MDSTAAYNGCGVANKRCGVARLGCGVANKGCGVVKLLAPLHTAHYDPGSKLGQSLSEDSSTWKTMRINAVVLRTLVNSP